jgi:hypothetical protein
MRLDLLAALPVARTEVEGAVEGVEGEWKIWKR